MPRSARTSLPLLPPLVPLTPRQLAKFDLVTGTPVALRTLREQLGLRRTVRVAGWVATQALLRDPLARLSRTVDPAEIMTRRQLRSVLLLHDGLIATAGLAREDARAVLRAVMLASGARFVAHFQPVLTPQGWAAASADQRSRYASDLVARLFNASVDQVRAEPASLAFDVVACRFVSLLRELDRLELAPLFCEVDDAFATMPGSYLKLDRTGTIATGALRCDFRLRFRGAPPE